MARRSRRRPGAAAEVAAAIDEKPEAPSEASAEVAAVDEKPEEALIFEVRASNQVPGDWPGYRFQPPFGKGARREDFYLRPEKLRSLFLPRLPRELEGDRRVVVTQVTERQMEQSDGRLSPLPGFIPCVGDPEPDEGEL